MLEDFPNFFSSINAGFSEKHIMWWRTKQWRNLFLVICLTPPPPYLSFHDLRNLYMSCMPTNDFQYWMRLSSLRCFIVRHRWNTIWHILEFKTISLVMFIFRLVSMNFFMTSSLRSLNSFHLCILNFSSRNFGFNSFSLFYFISLMILSFWM